MQTTNLDFRKTTVLIANYIIIIMEENNPPGVLVVQIKHLASLKAATDNTLLFPISTT
jgi:hypothetical protein